MDVIDVLLAKSVVSGDVGDLQDRVSELENNMAAITNPMQVKGRVDTYNDLPVIATAGWVYLVGLENDDNKKEFVYTDEGEWEFLGYHQEIDNALSATSENPVQNKVVSAALNGKQDGLSAAQLASANSGITSAKVANYDDIYAVLNYDRANHNNIFRGANLTSKYTVEQLYTKVHAGDFSDLYLGDYINVSLNTALYTVFTGTAFEDGVTYYERTGTHPAWTYAATTDTAYDSEKKYYTLQNVTETVAMMIAHFNYYYNCGDSNVVNYHHVILIPRTRLKTASYMNPSHTTVGAYYNSEMHQTILPCYAASFSTALENHVRTWRDRLSTEMTAATPSMAGGGLNGSATAWDWKDTNIRLMNEAQVYGTGIWSSSAYDYGCENRQLAVFRFISPVQYERAYYWLSSVVSSTYFAFVSGTGYASYGSAGSAVYVRPLIVFG